MNLVHMAFSKLDRTNDQRVKILDFKYVILREALLNESCNFKLDNNRRFEECL